MKLQNRFTLARPVDEVWAFFHDIDAVAECLPGASYEGTDEAGRHKGTMSVKIGPFQSKFEGAADVTYDETAKAVNMVGQGVDKRGGNRGKMTMDCQLTDQGGQTEVTVDSNIQMSGAIAQFGRAGIVEEFAKVLISDFVANAQARMGGEASGAAPSDSPAAAAPGPVSATGPGSAPGPDSAPATAAQDRPAPKTDAPRSGNAGSVSAGNLLWRSLVGWVKSLFGRG